MLFLIPILGALFLPACADDDDENPSNPNDKPQPLPDGQVYDEPDVIVRDSQDSFFDQLDASDAQDSDTTTFNETDVGPDTPSCEPTVCEGALSPHAADSTQAWCVTLTKSEIASNTSHTNAVIVDYNKDSRPDVFVLNNGQPNQLFINTITGFVDDSPKYDLNFGGTHRDAAFRDMDGDGDLDMLLTGSDGSVLYQNNNNSTVTRITGFEDSNPGTTAAWLGQHILIGTASEYGLRFYRNLGDNQFIEDGYDSGLADFGEARSITMADANGDSLPDIYVANETGSNRLFINLGNDRFESQEQTAGVLGSDDPSMAAQWVSHEGQSHPALFVLNWHGPASLFVREPNGTYADHAAVLGLQTMGPSKVAAWLDILGDSRPWVFVGRKEDKNLLYAPKLDAEHQVTGYEDRSYRLGLSPPLPIVASRSADFNGDGHDDLLLAMTDGPLQIFTSTATLIATCPEEVQP